MLNEEQVELWHKTTARVAKRNHDKPMQILLEEQDLQLGRVADISFDSFTKATSGFATSQKIPHSDADKLLSKQLTLHDYMESIKAELDL